MIFYQYLLRNVIYYPLFGHFLIPVPGSRNLFPSCRETLSIMHLDSCFTSVRSWIWACFRLKNLVAKDLGNMVVSNPIDYSIPNLSFCNFQEWRRNIRIGKGGFLSCKQGSAEKWHFYSLLSLNLYKFTQSNYEVHLAIINQSVVLGWVQNKWRNCIIWIAATGKITTWLLC